MKLREILLCTLTFVAIWLGVDACKRAERERALRLSQPRPQPQHRIVHVLKWLWKKE